MLCHSQLPVLGHMVSCERETDHPGEHRSRLTIHRTKAARARASIRSYSVEWGAGQPIALEPELGGDS